MKNDAHRLLVQEIRDKAVHLTGRMQDYVPLLEQAAKARFVLIGEATHGTEEFYRIRAELTKRLIEEHGFAAVTAEADWPDAYRVNRYVRGAGDIYDAGDALSDFTRFPSWMWRNEVMLDFVEWLRDYNELIETPHDRVGFYGLDVYSLRASIDAVIAYLDKMDPDAAVRARRYYSCFTPYIDEPQEYGYASTLSISESCEREVVRQLIELRQRAYDYIKRDGFAMEEDYFCAEQNARVIVDAEQYYRSMFKGRVSSWNLRDRHMADTLFSLAEHLGHWRSQPPKMVVWAHNSHIGDARATYMSSIGEWNLGQLVREHFPDESYLIGFSTYEGTVTAASRWDGRPERKNVRRGMKESYEELFHDVGMPDFLLFPKSSRMLEKHLDINRLQRAIGVLYLPETERQSHYFYTRLPQQFDAIIHIDSTQALKPLEPVAEWHKEKEFETYPSGF